MSIYRRGNTYWYEFSFQGQRIRDSAHTSSKTVAKEAEKQRRRELEIGVNRIPKRERPALFKLAAHSWIEARKPSLSKGAYDAYRASIGHLLERFEDRLVCDIDHSDVSALQAKLTAVGKSARTVNLAVAVLRMILKEHGQWAPIADHVRALRERNDVGRAISREDEDRLLDAIRQSRSPALLPLFVMSVDTGLRASELRHLRRRDLHLTYSPDGIIEAGQLVVSKSKTEGGTGRIVPLTRRACAVLSLWLPRLPQGEPDHYVFPAHKVGVSGNKRERYLYGVVPGRPMGFWKTAWQVALRRAGLDYRWHDCRHTFVSRICENPAVSETTIMALAGHVSKRMMERYSHVRTQAKREAIATLERADFASGSYQNPPQSPDTDAKQRSENTEKLLN